MGHSAGLCLTPAPCTSARALEQTCRALREGGPTDLKLGHLGVGGGRVGSVRVVSVVTVREHRSRGGEEESTEE